MSSPHSTPPTATSTHACGATGCGVDVAAATFMCDVHWHMVPSPLRQVIQDSYQGDQNNTANPYLRAAIAAVAHKEKRTRAPLPPEKPVQLALFDVGKSI